MMKNLYCIKDVKVGFINPFVSVNDATAIRDFKSSLSNGVVNYAPSDFELYKIGTFNDECGELHTDVQFLVNGISEDC